MMKRLLMTVVGVMVLTGCKDKQSEEASGAPKDMAFPVTVLLPEPKESTVKAELPGRLEAYRQAEVRARVAGIVQQRVYEEGQDVKEGDLLFTIEPDQYEAEYEAAKAQLERCEAGYLSAEDKAKVYTDLVDKSAVSKRDYLDAVMEERKAKAEVLAARAALKQAKLRLDYTRVTAPISGRARRALVTEGALVGMASPTPLTTVEQIDPIYVKFTQPASQVMAMRQAIMSGKWKGLDPHQVPIYLKMADGTEYALPGKLIFSDMAVDPGTDTVELRAEFPNPNKELLPGAYVQVEFERAVKRNVVLIPRESVIITAKGAIVMGVSPDNKVIPVPVELDGMDGTNWQVVGGVTPDMKVIVERHIMAVRPGVKVQIVREIKDVGELTAPNSRENSALVKKQDSKQSAN